MGTVHGDTDRAGRERGRTTLDEVPGLASNSPVDAVKVRDPARQARIELVEGSGSRDELEILADDGPATFGGPVPAEELPGEPAALYRRDISRC